MPHELENFDPQTVDVCPALAWAPTTSTVNADDYRKLLALYEMTVNRAESTMRKLQQLQAEVEDPEFYLRAINCPHEIDADKVVLRFDVRQDGHNALNQLSLRLTKPLKPFEPTEPLRGRLPPPERQQLWVLIDEALSQTHKPFERGDICNILAPVLAPLTSDKPDEAALIDLNVLLAKHPWMNVPLNFDEIRRNSDRYLELRNKATNSSVVSPMVVLVDPTPDYRLLDGCDVGDSLIYGRRLDHYMDRFLFPKAEPLSSIRENDPTEKSDETAT